MTWFLRHATVFYVFLEEEKIYRKKSLGIKWGRKSQFLIEVEEDRVRNKILKSVYKMRLINPSWPRANYEVDNG